MARRDKSSCRSWIYTKLTIALLQKAPTLAPGMVQKSWTLQKRNQGDRKHSSQLLTGPQHQSADCKDEAIEPWSLRCFLSKSTRTRSYLSKKLLHLLQEWCRSQRHYKNETKVTGCDFLNFWQVQNIDQLIASLRWMNCYKISASSEFIANIWWDQYM